MTKFWDKLSEGLGEAWVSRLLLPPVALLGLGLFMWIARDGFDPLFRILYALDANQGVILAILGLLLIALLDLLVGWLTLPILRLFEGYWPWVLGKLSRHFAKKITGIITKKRETWSGLAEKFPNLPRDQYDQYLKLDTELASMPANENQVMPTLLGNVLRSSEEYPYIRYGLEVRVTWPRLWLLLPETARNELSQARQELDKQTRFLIWGILVSVWVGFNLWMAVVSIIIAWMAYRKMVLSAGVYGELIKAAYDNYRFDLYAALHWKAPVWTDTEEVAGQTLTQYLHRGLLERPIYFKETKDKK